MSDNVDPARLRKEVEYYKRQLDELAGTNLKSEYEISGLRHELKQKRQGFALLSELQKSIGSSNEISMIFQTAAAAINSTLGMDRTLILSPTEEVGVYTPSFWLGYSNSDDAGLDKIRVRVPPEAADGRAPILHHNKSEPTPLAQQVAEAMKLPYFVCIGVTVEGTCVGVIISGRLLEKPPLYPALDQGDVDTFQSIAGLISAVIQNMKVAALQETDRLKTQFFANISHEFRTPITLTIGPLESILKKHLATIPPTLHPSLEGMYRNQVRLLSLVNQILDLAKLESGKMDIKAERVPDMNRFVGERAEQFISWAEKRGFKLLINLDPKAATAPVYIDKEKFDRIILNLMSNSCKFTKQGHVEVRTEIRDRTFVLAISDTGIGIKRTELPHLFDRFRQADGSASREYAGTGLGLALVKELVELHKGKISAQSEYGKGTTFEVAVPIGSDHLDPNSIIESTSDQSSLQSVKMQAIDIREGKATDDELAQVEKQNLKTEQELKPGVPIVLYTDDNRDMRAYVHSVLAPHYNVFLGVHGKHGLETAKRFPIDLILSDVMMPVMTGVEFCRAARQDKRLKVLPFVLLTAKTDFDSKLEGLDEGADDYLSKPFSEVELLTRIRNLLRLREQQLRIQRELLAAREIQQSMLPKRNQTFPTIDISAVYYPCDELSGDFYDIIPTQEWIYFYVADVTSHGTAAAQVTYIVKQLFQQALSENPAVELPTLMAQVGPRYRAYELKFGVGIQLGRYRPSDRNFEYVISNAPRAILASAEKTETLVVRPGPSLEDAGELTPESFPVFRQTLKPGERMYFFTDGLYEFDDATTKRALGMKGFKKIVETLPVEGWDTKLVADLVQVNGQPEFPDDLTIVRILIS